MGVPAVGGTGRILQPCSGFGICQDSSLNVAFLGICMSTMSDIELAGRLEDLVPKPNSQFHDDVQRAHRRRHGDAHRRVS